jgi:hypothetical protein
VRAEPPELDAYKGLSARAAELVTFLEG